MNVAVARRRAPTDAAAERRRFFGMLLALATREFKGRYRRSLLGPAWAFVQPLLFLTVFLFLRRAGAIRVDTGGIPYPVFALSALVPWTFFSGALARSAPSVPANAGIVKKTAAPREVYPLSGILVSLADLFCALTLVLGVILWHGAIPPGRLALGMLVWLPPLIALAFLLASGFGLILAGVGAFKNDVAQAVPFLLQFWMLATPVMYPFTAERGGLAGVWMRWNPMTGVVEGFRSVLARGEAPDLALLGSSALVGFCVLLVARPFFRYVSQYFADVL